MTPANAYQRRSVEGSSPIGLIVLLYQAAVVELRRAIAAMEAQSGGYPGHAMLIETRTRSLNRLLAIVAELKRALDFERGGEVARNLSRFYQLSERLVMQASLQRDPQPLTELLEQYTLILNAWRDLDARPPEAPPVRTAWSA